MLGLAEYRATAADLQTAAQAFDAEMAKQLKDLTKKPEVYAARKAVFSDYMDEYRHILDTGIRDVAENAANYYVGKLGLTDYDVKGYVDDIVQQQYKEKYYGANLEQRLKVNYLGSARKVVYSGVAITTEAMAAHKRLLLGTMVKIENDTAKAMATAASLRLIRWTLSGRHAITCACDDLASAVDGQVVRYMEENKITESPRGMYFVEDLPHPPHPNCQCEYAMVIGNKTQSVKKARRTVTKIRSLLKRLRKR